MTRQILAILLIVLGISWTATMTFYSRTDDYGNRVDLLGLSYPEEVFSYHARRSALHPKHFDRFQYPHFYLDWGGFILLVGFGVHLIRQHIRKRTYYPKGYGHYGT